MTHWVSKWLSSLLERLVTLKRTFREKWGPMLELLRTSSRNWYSPAHAFLTGLFVVKQTRQILRLGYCNDLPNSQMFSRILDRSFSLSFSKSQCQHLFKTYERSKYQWVIKIPMSDQNTNEQSKYQQMLSYKVHNTNGQKYQQKNDQNTILLVLWSLVFWTLVFWYWPMTLYRHFWWTPFEALGDRW